MQALMTTLEQSSNLPNLPSSCSILRARSAPAVSCELLTALGWAPGYLMPGGQVEMSAHLQREPGVPILVVVGLQEVLGAAGLVDELRFSE